ncbi:phosphatidylinositide phosphatase spermathreecae isoform X3 [Rhodnius prolixus]|uniref:phosphatidylinositide phosphatase spermathreecae isoform X3 n=1 Tax=Rhodnius prolixus TaxID=13249 RepID=UPI003D18B976
MNNRNYLQEMEVFRTDEFYVLMNGESSLWCNRRTGEVDAKPGWELANSGDPECLGIFYGLVGKIDFQIDGEYRLMLIKETEEVGDLPDGRTVMKIRSVVFLYPCGADVSAVELGLKSCKKHKAGNMNMFEVPQKAALAKTWGQIKSATNSIKTTTQQAAALATYQVKSGIRRDVKEREKFERRILEELMRVFTETDSFYFCAGPPGSREADLTNCLQKQHSERSDTDDRFFWNRFMLKDIIDLNNELAKAWILPIIQGYVQIEHCIIDVDPSTFGNTRTEKVTLGIISRRSRYRAGTRYKRRGLDDSGKCANYVETEQFLSNGEHHLSFVQVRGSVPLYWSQPGYKYRPPPHIDKGESETKAAFVKHIQEELNIYGPICIVNLVEQSGKEKVIWEGFTQQVMQYNSEVITYATFDFHEHCRGLRFENVSLLISNLEEVIQEIGFCWKDKEGVICKQKGAFRVNCIDCLDRTNVVQTAIGKAVLEVQLTKLGLLPPEGNLPSSLRTTFQSLWANNGDVISKQYAGTNALKGDYTRTGERKLTGMMKDGMNSANRYMRRLLYDELRQCCYDACQGEPISNPSTATIAAHEFLELVAAPVYSSRLHLEQELLLGIAVYHLSRDYWRYYLSRFKDVYRQATIDIMQGQVVSEDLGGEDDADSAATAEHVKLLIEDCKKLLISDSSLILGAWGLINADPLSGDPLETDMDTILILTRDSYYVADYDDEIDKVTKCQRIPLSDIAMVELGPVQVSHSNNPLQIFNKSKNKAQPHYCLRLRYKLDDCIAHHTFRSSNLRFFNNVAIVIKTEEEMIESLRAICDCLRVALEVADEGSVQWHLGAPLNKVQSQTSSNNFLQANPTIPRNISETQLENIKNVGSKALSNVTSKFSKLGNTFNQRRKSSVTQRETQVPAFTVGDEDNSAGSDEDGEVSGNIGGGSNKEKTDTFLPNVGIVMSNTVILQAEDVASTDDVIITTTEDAETSSKTLNVVKPKELKVRTFSHSSGEVDDPKEHLKPDDGSVYPIPKGDLTLGVGSCISTSQSENALRTLKSGFSSAASSVLSSPQAVLSPLSRLAKGMQNLGANLDPRKLKSGSGISSSRGGGAGVSGQTLEASPESARLKEAWAAQGCKSRAKKNTFQGTND